MSERYTPVLQWSVNGIIKKYRLKPGRYYIGRPTGRFKERIPDYTREKGKRIYIFPEDPNLMPKDTGFVSDPPVVSRLHVELIVNEDGSVIVKDHGPTGEGSLNGTWVNSRKLTHGEEVLVRPPNQFLLRLAGSGPSFLVVFEDVEENTIISIDEKGIEVPASIARDISRITRRFGREVGVIEGGDEAKVYFKGGDEGVIVVNGLKLVFRRDNIPEELAVLRDLDESLVKIIDVLDNMREDSSVIKGRISMILNDRYIRVIDKLIEEGIIPRNTRELLSTINAYLSLNVRSTLMKNNLKELEAIISKTIEILEKERR